MENVSTAEYGPQESQTAGQVQSARLVSMPEILVNDTVGSNQSNVREHQAAPQFTHQQGIADRTPKTPSFASRLKSVMSFLLTSRVASERGSDHLVRKQRRVAYRAHGFSESEIMDPLKASQKREELKKEEQKSRENKLKEREKQEQERIARFKYSGH